MPSILISNFYFLYQLFRNLTYGLNQPSLDFSSRVEQGWLYQLDFHRSFIATYLFIMVCVIKQVILTDVSCIWRSCKQWPIDIVGAEVMNFKSVCTYLSFITLIKWHKSFHLCFLILCFQRNPIEERKRTILLTEAAINYIKSVIMCL